MSLEPYFSDEMLTLFHADCLEVLRSLPDASVDAVVTDPPYGLEFMGRDWDTFKPSAARIRERRDGRTNRADGEPSITRTPEAYVAGPPFYEWCLDWSAECLRVLKPGGYLLAFGGTRVYHWLAAAIETAGFEIRDSLHWFYGGGFPKGKACLKPAHEPIVMARKPSRRSEPLPGLDACRVAFAGNADLAETEGKNRHADFGSKARDNHVFGAAPRPRADDGNYDGSGGRWPPNVLLGHAEGCEPAGTRTVASNARARKKPAGAVKFPGTYGELVNDEDRSYGAPGQPETVEAWDCAGKPRQSAAPGDGYGMTHTGAEYADAGGASRFFPQFRYEPKAPASERPRLPDGTAWPTVKPVDLVRWLVRLVTPPDGLVLDPFAGTGTTAEACIVEGFRCILIERDPVAVQLATKRLSKPLQPLLDFGEAG